MSVDLHSTQAPSLSLTSLDLSCPSGANASLSVSGITLLADAIRDHVTLLELDLQWNGLTGACIEILAQSLVHNKSIETLCLSHNPMKCTGAVALATLLAHNSTLLRLYLDETEILGDGTDALMQTLQSQNRSLLELSLRGNRCQIHNIVAKSMSLMVRTNRTLRILDLRNIKFTLLAHDMAALAAAKKENPALEVLISRLS